MGLGLQISGSFADRRVFAQDPQISTAEHLSELRSTEAFMSFMKREVRLKDLGAGGAIVPVG